MRRLFYIFVILLSAFPVFGQRVPIYKGQHSYNDIFVTEDVENNTFDIVLQMPTYSDSLFFVVGERDLPALHLYFQAIRDKFTEWSSIAKKNKVDDFKKDFDFSPPVLRIRWVQNPTDGYWSDRIQRKTFQTEETDDLHFYFSVYKGVRRAACDILAIDKITGQQRKFLLLLNNHDLNHIIKWTDPQRVRKAYIKNSPKMTAEEVNSLFE